MFRRACSTQLNNSRRGRQSQAAGRDPFHADSHPSFLLLPFPQTLPSAFIQTGIQLFAKYETNSKMSKNNFLKPNSSINSKRLFHFPKKILLLAFCISVTEAKVIHEAWSLPEDISMKRYCREGKKCSIEAAIECGAICALDCGMPCTLQLQLALCTSAVNLLQLCTLCVFTYMYILCVERGAA